MFDRHTIIVKQRKPAPAIDFQTFSRWFIPEDEKCGIAYKLQGV